MASTKLLSGMYYNMKLKVFSKNINNRGIDFVGWKIDFKLQSESLQGSSPVVFTGYSLKINPLHWLPSRFYTMNKMYSHTNNKSLYR